MKHLRHTSLITWLFAVLLAVAANTAFAAECPFSGTSYTAPYTSPIGLPRCGGTIGRWTVCEVCQISNATYTATQAYTLSYPTAGTGLQPRATFTQGATSLTVNGFLDSILADGRAVFRIRFAPTTNSGTWSFSATSSDSGLAFSSRSLTAGTSTSKGFLRRHTNNPERFIYDNGTTRFFMWGNTYYQFIDNARSGGTSWKTSVDENASRSINKIRMLLYPWWQYFAGYPDSQPFQGGATTPNHDLLDLAHWQKFDEVVDYMNKKPMISEIIVFKDPALDSNNAVIDNCRTFGTTQAQDERYVRYTLARFGAFPNVIWSMSNEYGAINKPACTSTRSWLSGGLATLQTYFNTMGSILRNEDPWNTGSANPRALTIHQQPDSTWDFFTYAWPVHASLQFGTSQTSCLRCSNPNSCAGNTGDDWGNFSIVNNILKCNGTRYNFPVVNDEYGYIGKIANADKHRRAAWGIAVAGGYGAEGDTLAAANGASVLLYGDWRDAGAYYTDIQRMVNYITGIANWFQMGTNNGIVTAGSRVYAMSKPNNFYLVYAATGGDFTLNLPAPAVGSYAVFRWNPRTGGAETFVKNVGAGASTFTVASGEVPDSTNDWVFRIKAQ